MMPLVTSSENGLGQTESPLEIFGEMWCCKIMCGLILSLFNYCWNTLTVEGDSPVDLGYFGFVCFLSSVHWKLGVNLFFGRHRLPILNISQDR